jgi:hypothetical protein
MKITTYTTNIILEKDEPKLRSVLGELARKTAFTDYLMWWNEDNTGNIQITNIESSRKVLEEELSFIKENFDEDDYLIVESLIKTLDEESDIEILEYGV